MNVNIEQETGNNPKRQAQGHELREEKRRKFEAKQARKEEEARKLKERQRWFQEHSHFAQWISETNVGEALEAKKTTKSEEKGNGLLPYLDIQDQPIKETNNERLFIAEGTETVRLLIQQPFQERKDGLSGVKLESIFVKPNLLFDKPVRLLDDVLDTCQRRDKSASPSNSHPGFQVLVGAESAMSKIAGFPISRGALACGVIPTDRTEEWFHSFVAKKVSEGHGLRLMALDGICDSSNLGSMIRCASAFGIDAIVISKDTCEAWYRRTVRVSMGHIFRVPIVRVEDLAGTLQGWSKQYPQLHSFAAVIDTDNLLETMQPSSVPSTWCCVLGNEGNGISPSVADACTQRLRIDMEKEVDSLSVPIACGILLHGLRERESRVVTTSANLET
eukprot:Nitzschia sp. Nitz4//scaffold74_size92883//3339//4508//NITZ4_004806-RA/size92883-processed-gene-0.73-mRNA-1//-1//CDS//3329557544//2721//frame0